MDRVRVRGLRRSIALRREAPARARVAMLVLPPVAAVGKPRRADLSVSKVSLSAGPALGATVKLWAVVRNAGKAPARPSQLSVGLAGMRAPLARKRVARLAAGQEEDGQRRGQVPEHHRRRPLRGRRLR